jgi:hypothetical protein
MNLRDKKTHESRKNYTLRNFIVFTLQGIVSRYLIKDDEVSYSRHGEMKNTLKILVIRLNAQKLLGRQRHR